MNIVAEWESSHLSHGQSKKVLVYWMESSDLDRLSVNMQLLE